MTHMIIMRRGEITTKDEDYNSVPEGRVMIPLFGVFRVRVDDPMRGQLGGGDDGEQV